MLTDRDIERYTNDIVTWAEEQYILIETGQPIRLAEHQKRILREMTRRDDNGRFLYQTLIYSAPKKSGKTEIAALYTLWTAIFIAEPYGEIYICANDLEQSQGRVFQALVKTLRANNIYNADITAREITFSTGTKIVALANDYQGAAGSNPNLTVWSELWGYTSENSRRLWEELTPVPTRKNSIRLVETYAGFEGESELLLELYQRGLAGERIFDDLPVYRKGRLLMFWDHSTRMSWQTSEYYDEQRRQLRPNQFIRLHENRFVSSESQFISYEKWLACERPGLLHPFPSKRLTVVVGVDLATKRDGAAICAVMRLPGNRMRVVAHRFWVPSKENEINLSEVETELREWCRKYRVHCIYYDPFQSEFLAQRLRHTLGNSKVRAFPQTPSNLEMAANELYSAIEDRRLEVYPSEEFRSQIRHVVAVETSRGGWRVAKDRQSSRVDLVAALSFACTAAVEMPISNQYGMAGIHCIRMSPNRPVVSCPIFGGRVYDPQCHHCDALLGFFDSTVERIVEEGCRRSTPIESVSEYVRRRPDTSEGICIVGGGPPEANKARHNFKYPKIQRG